MKLIRSKILGWIAGAVAATGFVAVMGALAIQPAARAVPPPAVTPMGLPDVLFYALAGLTVTGALGVALSRNILYSAIGLLIALLGAGSLYVFLSADFLAVAQLLVYIGGVLVLILFAVMLTNRVTEIEISNTSFGLWGGIMLFVATLPVLLAVALVTPWASGTPAPAAYTTEALGNAFLSRWLLPFEVASMVLLATLVGAIVIARKEIKADD
jgi:NAD(P)H-quinone oxidoreductase subunit 6